MEARAGDAPEDELSSAETLVKPDGALAEAIIEREGLILSRRDEINHFGGYEEWRHKLDWLPRSLSVISEGRDFQRCGLNMCGPMSGDTFNTRRISLREQA